MSNKKHKLTIFLGDVDESVAQLAAEFDASAWLLDHSNYKKFLISERDHDDVIYTSLGDLPKDLEIVYLLLRQADTVIYCPPAQWSDNKSVNFTDPGDSIQGLTEIMLSLLPSHIEIKNFSPGVADLRPLTDKRKDSGPQLWSVGCSITHGIGVDPQQRYGQLLADELSMPCSFLTHPGSAIEWAADQILRSDIRSNDLVIWGLTHPERFTYVHDNQLVHVNADTYVHRPQFYKIVDPLTLCSQNTIYQQYYAIQHVINYCEKIKAQLILVELLHGGHALSRVLKFYKNYVKIDYEYSFKNSHMQTQFIDLGTDNRHPGPQQHLHYKKNVLDKLKQLEII